MKMMWLFVSLVSLLFAGCGTPRQMSATSVHTVYADGTTNVFAQDPKARVMEDGGWRSYRHRRDLQKMTFAHERSLVALEQMKSLKEWRERSGLTEAEFHAIVAQFYPELVAMRPDLQRELLQIQEQRNYVNWSGVSYAPNHGYRGSAMGFHSVQGGTRPSYGNGGVQGQAQFGRLPNGDPYLVPR